MLDKLNAIANYISKMTSDEADKKRKAAKQDMADNGLEDEDDAPTAAYKASKSINKAMNMEKP